MPADGQPIADFARELADRTPTPGAGAAAAVAGALGAAAGAMAARFTTGESNLGAQVDALKLAEWLDAVQRRCLALADEEAAAYAAWRAARVVGQGPALAQAEARVAAVPAEILSTAAQAAEALAAFLPRCDPRLAHAVRSGVHLCAGAARAALACLLVNRIDVPTRTAARDHLARAAAAEGLALVAP